MRPSESGDAGDSRKQGRDAHGQRPPNEESGGHGGSLLPHGRTETPAFARLAELWPRVAKSVVRSLLARGLPAQVVEDAVQEAAYQAVAKGFDPPTYRALERWARVVAHNWATDWLRAAAREDERSIELTEEAAQTEDVWETVERRAVLEALPEAIRRLSLQDREVLAAAEEERRGTTAEERRRFAVRLHRARARLAERLRRWPVAVVLRWRAEDPFAGAPHLVALATAGTLGAAALLMVTAATPGPHTIDRAPVVVTASDNRTSVVTSVPDRPPRAAVSVTTHAPSPAAEAAIPEPSPPLVAHRRVEVQGPAGPVLDAGTHDPPPRAPLACFTNVPRLGTHCVPHPLH